MFNFFLKSLFIIIFIPSITFSLTIGSDGKISNNNSSNNTDEKNSNQNDCNSINIKQVKKNDLKAGKPQWKELSKKQKNNFNKYVFKGDYQEEGAMVFNHRNVSDTDRYEFFDEFKDEFISENGIKIDLSYSDEGPKDDWIRWENPGFAQRWQIMERVDFAANKGEEKWYRIFVHIPEDTNAFLHQLSFFDFKYIECLGEKSVGPSFNLRGKDFVSTLTSPYYFKYISEGDALANAHGDLAITYNADFTKFKGVWLGFLMNVKWAEDGHFHLWLNGKLRKSFYGDTIFHYDRVRFKFGPYRSFMDDATKMGETIEDVSIRFATVGRGDTCDGVWYGGCDQFTSQLTGFSQLNGVEKLVLCQQVKDKKRAESTRATCNNYQDRVGTKDPMPFIPELK